MAVAQVDGSNQIAAFKRKLGPRREVLKRAYAEVKNHVQRAVDKIAADVAAGRGVVPELDYQDIRNNTVPDALRQRFAAQAVRWFAECFPSSLRETGSRKLANISRQIIMNRGKSRSGASTSIFPG